MSDFPVEDMKRRKNEMLGRLCERCGEPYGSHSASGADCPSGDTHWLAPSAPDLPVEDGVEWKRAPGVHWCMSHSTLSYDKPGDDPGCELREVYVPVKKKTRRWQQTRTTTNPNVSEKWKCEAGRCLGTEYGEVVEL